MKNFELTLERYVVNNTPNKDKSNEGGVTKSKSPSQLIAEALLKSKEAALLYKENTKTTLKIRAAEATIRIPESKCNNDFIISILDHFKQVDNTG